MMFAAEVGLNHDGNFNLAYELIRQAKMAGATIAKFQFGWRNKPDEINCIDLARARQLKEWCDYWDIEMMASIITEDALDLARALSLRRYKIASRTVVDKPELCRAVMAEGKETFVSLGMWDKDGFPFGPPTPNLRYIYCRSQYPTYPQDLRGFPGGFDEAGFYGYSDHCQGTSACLLALSRGARYIEKHITLNKTSQVIRDHVLSATPDEFAELVRVGWPLARLTATVGGR
jgi:N,N'-diacetyllegionaminate synthase